MTGSEFPLVFELLRLQCINTADCVCPSGQKGRHQKGRDVLRRIQIIWKVRLQYGSGRGICLIVWVHRPAPVRANRFFVTAKKKNARAETLLQTCAIVCVHLLYADVLHSNDGSIQKGLCGVKPDPNVACKDYRGFSEKWNRACEGDVADSSAEITCADEDNELNDTPTGSKEFDQDTRKTTYTNPTPYYWWIRIAV